MSLSAPTFAQRRGGHRGQPEDIVQLAIGEQTPVELPSSPHGIRA